MTHLRERRLSGIRDNAGHIRGPIDDRAAGKTTMYALRAADGT